MKKSPLLFLSALALAWPVFSARAQTGPAYTLHEWGTFTTVAGSDGGLLPGLQREEEGLPWFVGSHEGMENRGQQPSEPDGSLRVGKGYIRPLKNVTVKMETPVIYFYTRQPFQARVAVDFHGGSISQWYPPRSGGEIPPGDEPQSATGGGKMPGFSVRGAGIRLNGGEIDFAQGYEGSICWDVAVTPPSESDSAQIFRGDETANWLFPRQTDSALVHTADGTAEKFLFYRGVGRFDLPVVTRMNDDRVLQIENRGQSAVPRLFVYEMGSGGCARFQLLDALPAGKSVSVDLEKLPQIGQWQRPVYDTLEVALMQAGLYRKEADAMLQTWWKSYFERTGLRVFWIVPRDFTEQILPLRVQPAPTNSVRVLAGRSEVLRPSFEQALVQEKTNPNAYVMKNDRFLEAYAARVRQLDMAK